MKVVYCLADSEPQGNAILTNLRNNGFDSSMISVVLDGNDTRNISLKENAVRGAEKGGLFGGILGGLAGLTALAIPGFGAALIAGPLISALGGAAVGGVVGGLTGGSGAFVPGLSKEATDALHNHIREGAVLIAVHSDDDLVRQRAARIFKAEGGKNIFDLERVAS
jgi:hypothetical protein